LGKDISSDTQKEHIYNSALTPDGESRAVGICFKELPKISAAPVSQAANQDLYDKPTQELTHKDKACGYIQTSGQLFGALGLVASGLLEGNIARVGLGGFNSLRSSFKLVSDIGAKSRSQSHRNDVVEGGVATSANSIGFLNVRSPEELVAVTLGVTAWATKAMTAFIHKRAEDKNEQGNAEIDSNNKFFEAHKVTPPESGVAVKVVGLISKNMSWIKDKAMEGTLAVMSHAPPLMMGGRAVSYLMDGINNNDMAMAGGGAAFIVGSVLMAVKDHGSYMKAKATREHDRSLKEKMADDFDHAEQGDGLTAVVNITIDGQRSVDWGDNKPPEATTHGLNVDVGSTQNLKNNTVGSKAAPA
jgi:hypothetical protein